jgi:hypothetical protein
MLLAESVNEEASRLFREIWAHGVSDDGTISERLDDFYEHADGPGGRRPPPKRIPKPIRRIGQRPPSTTIALSLRRRHGHLRHPADARDVIRAGDRSSRSA